MTTTECELDVGDELEITKLSRRAAGNGTWVAGRLNGYRFQALVFPAHAQDSEWELGNSRISKLWVQRIADRCQVFNWDRGADVAAAGDIAMEIVDFLTAGLADHVYG